jgi:glyoxylase-like metal-dependent hydrolase (beta-lactamase superfamily II)
MKKVILGILALLLVALGIIYFTLVAATSTPEGCSYTLDMKELRALAASMPGDKPSEVRVEDVSGTHVPLAVAVAGSSWDKLSFRAYAYQVVYPDKTVIVDTAMDSAQAEEAHMTEGYDAEAWQRVAKGMGEASAIYVTHEHADHMGGAVASEAWAKNLRLTPRQLDSDTPSRAVVSPAVRAAVQPLVYEHATAVAPGLVLIEAAGHTPGSQMVYVNRADGGEVILTGDTAWLMANVERRQTPAKLVFLLLKGADRQRNACQLAALDQVRQSEPTLAIMSGHDKARMDNLMSQGVFTARFK